MKILINIMQIMKLIMFCEAPDPFSVSSIYHSFVTPLSSTEYLESLGSESILPWQLTVSLINKLT